MIVSRLACSPKSKDLIDSTAIDGHTDVAILVARPTNAFTARLKAKPAPIDLFGSKRSFRICHTSPWTSCAAKDLFDS